MFDPQQLRGVHGEMPQPQAQQQTGVGRVPCHFATQTHLFAGRRALGDGVGQQLQHGGVQRVVQVRHLFIGAVDGQGVLNQVIGADR